MTEPIQVTGGELKAVPIRGGQAQGVSVVYHLIVADDRCIADTEGADDLPTVVDEGNARLLAAAANSYKRQCSDPVRAAEADLLGEALALARDIANIADCVPKCDKSRTSAERMLAETGHSARQFIAGAEVRQP